MRTQNLLLAGAGMLVLIALGFMTWAVPQVQRPAATALAPTLLAAQTPVAANTDYQTGGAVDAGIFTLTLPAKWRMTTRQWSGAPAENAPLVMAWHGDKTFEQSPERFSAINVPRNDLSLEQYLIDVRDQLSGTEEVSSVTGEVVTDLRVDGLPAALIGYSIATPTGEFTGYQAVLFAPDDAQLIIATLVRRKDLGAGSEALLRAILGSLRFAGQESSRAVTPDTLNWTTRQEGA